MSIFSAIWMGFREVWANKLRSFLTLFCVLLGVASVVVTVAYMRGLTARWKEGLKEGGGIEKLSVRKFRVPAEKAHLAGLSPGHTIADADAVRKLCPHLVYVSPMTQSVSVIYRGRKRDRTDIEGVYPEARIIENFDLESGRFISDEDIAHRNQVIVIGNMVYDRLFEPGENPIGQKVTFGGLVFEIVGLLKNYELNMGRWNMLRWKNDIAFVPLTTMQHKINGSGETEGMDILVEDAKYIPQVVPAIENILRGMHRGVEDFRVNTNEQRVASLEKTERNQVATGAAVSLITIIIGGIGIMNLMLASINERVREIGIRKALGARRRDVFFQFSVESITLCVLGGIVGVMVGQGVIALLQRFLEVGSKPVYTNLGVIMGFGASVLIGILAGLYPAVKASRMDPIEALRYE